jgi:hypothetical protein
MGLTYVRGLLVWVWLLLGVVGCYEPDDDDDDEQGEARWVCFEGTLDCRCWDVSDGTQVDSSEPEVLACRAFNCCLLDTDYGQCICEDLNTDCQAEANSRPGTAVVPTCPPGDIDLSRCAGSGVNCREDFLQTQNLVGCCPGLTCLMNAEGVPVCL